MTLETTQLERFRSLPRAIQWALVAGVGILLFFVWDSWIRPLKDDIQGAANSLEGRVADVRQARDIDRNLRLMESEVIGLGKVAVPVKQAPGAEALQELVNEVLKKHAVTNQKYETRTRGRLPSGTLANVAPGKRLDRQTGELTFVATTDEAMAVISELESSPVVYAITSLRMVREQSSTRKIKITLSLESWVISNDVPTRGGQA